MLTGKVAIVTGGSRGIGKAIAEKLASMGADVAILYVGNSEAAEKTVMDITAKYGIKARAFCCDVADYSAVKETVANVKNEFGNIHILINNAGITRDGLIATMSEESFDAVIDTNLKGAFNMIRHTAGIFMRNRSGVIVNISSVSGLMGNVGQANYAASKAGMIGLTKTIAKELAPRGIRCNAVAPGLIDTEMTQHLDEKENPLITAIPLKRRGKPEEVAEAVAFLITADYITGEVLRVDGGLAI